MAQYLPKLKNNPYTTVCYVCRIISFIVLIINPCVAAALSFSFPSFSPNNDQDIMYNGSAAPASDAIALTRNQIDKSTSNSTGTARYARRLQLWDKASGRLTDFTTHFAFVIKSVNENDNFYGDGLAFFLAPVDSGIPLDVGGSLGLTYDNQTTLNSTDHPFVAVEFDIYQNPWDPSGAHVGIDINSMVSVVNTTWSTSNSITKGTKHDAQITYDSDSKSLVVEFSGFSSSGTPVRQNLSCIVDLRKYLPEVVTFGFTASTGQASALHSILSWNFSSTLQIDTSKTSPGVVAPMASPPTHPGVIVPMASPPSKSKMGLVIGLLIVGGSVLVGGSGFLLFVFRKRRGRRDYEGETAFEIPELEAKAGPKKFSYADMTRATNNFAEHEKLGEGGFGGVYKGYLRELDTYIAVKRVCKGSSQGLKEYTSEVKTITQLRHRNLVQLIGWCHEKSDELLLVYEFMPNGSLDYHLFKGKSLLSWETRYKIVQDIAAALLYLHEGWEQCVVHRDIKSSNVLLDSTFNARLGDFGLARLVDHEKGSQTTILAGTIGYMDSESVITGKASKESDVYSFGVVALEIACGRRPIVPNAQESEVNLVEWVWNLYGAGRLVKAAEPKLSSYLNQQEIEHLMVVGLWCAHPDKRARPTIKQASNVLNFEAPLPILPSTMPVASYDTIPVFVDTFPSTSSSGNVVSQSSQIKSSIDAARSSTASASPS